MKYPAFLITSLLVSFNISGQAYTDTSFKQKEDYASAKIFPNPATNKVTIQVMGFKPGILQLKITDRNGMVFRDDHRLLVNGNEDIVLMFLLPPGIYFMLLSQKENRLKKKLVVH